jgi:hypothetical protein
MPNQVDGVLVHSMSDYELSRVRTELYQLPILPTIPPHPVQPHDDSSRHRHLGNVPLPAHRSEEEFCRICAGDERIGSVGSGSTWRGSLKKNGDK